MHSPLLIVLLVALTGALAQAQGGPSNSTLPTLPTLPFPTNNSTIPFPSRNSTVPSPGLTLRPSECEKKLNLEACLGMNLKETATEAEMSNALKTVICAPECSNTLSKISRDYVEEQCGFGARLGTNFDFLLPILPTLSTFMCTTDPQGNMCAAVMKGAQVQSGVKPQTNPKTNRLIPIPVDKFPKSFTCSECAAKIQDAAKAADAVAKAKSSAGKTYSIDSLFPYDDASVATRKSTCPAGAASATTTGGSNSASRNAGAATSVVALVVAVALVMA
ncbi:hypothetical protein BCR44DRAFT_1509885 [Catenaria anguillulae PL171]|uniref:Saposin B-type domain-containing protein n=1 Tax=Catenaria anguillulae PL171 TaxID=765915 RepID=A0A1Y2HZ93_9FUNG|nr:hypothetical protein BCR44DRAFT_1509885 [Catenaria anguillulae PL171]